MEMSHEGSVACEELRDRVGYNITYRYITLPPAKPRFEVLDGRRGGQVFSEWPDSKRVPLWAQLQIFSAFGSPGTTERSRRGDSQTGDVWLSTSPAPVQPVHLT